jgi:predicted NAD/FAD-binding protein
MRIAVVGTGISGLVAAHLLHRDHDLTIFEAQSHIGGHTLTSDVSMAGRQYAVDAGFIVYNETNYPNFVRLLDRLGVETQPTSMSFSVKCGATGLEYAGTSLNALFAQRRNLLSVGFLRMLREIGRFNREALQSLANDPGDETLRDFLQRGGYSDRFIQHYLVAMAAAIWSTDPERMLSVPARFLFGFLDNHGLLSIDGHHPWRVITGGSRSYVRKLVAPFRDRVRLDTPVLSLDRQSKGVAVSTPSSKEIFDQVVIATHSDQALRMLAEPTDGEREILSAIPYQPNEAVLHTDESVLPTRRRAWASWNYYLPERPSETVAVTYNMSELQSLDTETPFCVSLNMTDHIDPAKIIRSFSFDHPLFTPESVAAQKRHSEISGVDRIHYCGAYWRNGFHEDGVVSGLEIGKAFGESLS